MQIVTKGDNFHEMSNPVLGENKKNITILSSAELAQKVVKVKGERSDLIVLDKREFQIVL